MTEIQKLDCSGLVCPLPVAKTKKMMINMKSGDILEVSGDFWEAGENIKRFIIVDIVVEMVLNFVRNAE